MLLSLPGEWFQRDGLDVASSEELAVTSMAKAMMEFENQYYLLRPPRMILFSDTILVLLCLEGDQAQAEPLYKYSSWAWIPKTSLEYLADEPAISLPAGLAWPCLNHTTAYACVAHGRRLVVLVTAEVKE